VTARAGASRLSSSLATLAACVPYGAFDVAAALARPRAIGARRGRAAR
jgi:hypothetical protein